MRLLLFFMSISTLASAQSDWLSAIQQKWEGACDYTKEVVEKMPEEAFGYRPEEAMMSFEEQVLHLCRNANWLSTTYLEGEGHLADLKTPGYSKAELLTILAELKTQSTAAIGNLEETDLDAVHDFFAGPMSTRQILLLMHDHMTHHRGQLIVYLRLNGQEPPPYRAW